MLTTKFKPPCCSRAYLGSYAKVIEMISYARPEVRYELLFYLARQNPNEVKSFSFALFEPKLVK